VIFSNVGLGGCKGAVTGIGPLYPMARFDVPGLTSIFEYGVVDVKESATEAGRDGAASALAATCVELSADFGRESVSWRLGTRTGNGLESV
jgi:hypothetical protein